MTGTFFQDGTSSEQRPIKAAGDAMEISGRKALVVGLGRTGLSVSRFLKGRGAEVIATDIRPAAEIDGVRELTSMDVTVHGGGHVEADFLNADLIVVSPGVPGEDPLLRAARGKGAEVISDVELAWRFMDVPVIAVAGTNGKSTTTALIGEIFELAGMDVFVGGNIGVPAIEFMEREKTPEACVLEISSFHLETIKGFRPHIGVLLNITEDHLARYRGFDHYVSTKMRLFENQTCSDYAVINASDPVIAEHIREIGEAEVVGFTASGTLDGESGVFLRGEDIVYLNKTSGQGEVYPAGLLRLKGLQNIENAMAAVAVARLSGVSRDVIIEAFRKFAGLRHRMEFVRELAGVTYIDDSKGTNTGALRMALKGIEPPVVLIAGGRDKGGDYGPLAGLVAEKVKLLIVMGEAAGRIRDAFSGVVEVFTAGSMEEAVLKARWSARPRDTVLLCPACSSFDMFRDFKERGARFRALVEGLG